MISRTRRAFLGDVGRGMLLAGLGSSLASELGLAHANDGEFDSRLTFGRLEPTAALMQETEPVKLTALLVEKLRSGESLKSLVAAGALANARTFGGEDYVGFHTFMALAPAYKMAQLLPPEHQPLPVLKVLYRNANRIQEFGGRGSEVLRAVPADPIPADVDPGIHLRELSRAGEVERADRAFGALAGAPIGEAFNHVQFAVEDEVDVHRVVLAWRAWDTFELAGPEWAHVLMRQSIRYCAKTERQMIDRGHARSDIRTVLPALLDEYKLLGRERGNRTGDDAWLRELAEVILKGTREEAAGAVAAALAEAYSPESVGEAISVAANLLVLYDSGRQERWASPEKPAGSCHGDSVGVHASDAANAWRNIARVSNSRNSLASLIVGAFHTAGQMTYANEAPYPLPEHLAEVTALEPGQLLSAAEEAIRGNDQARAAAIMARYAEGRHDSGAAFRLMLKYATSEDGALHAEKFYRTASEEFATTRETFRWNQLVALARVTASQFGYASPGYQEAKRLLNT